MDDVGAPAQDVKLIVYWEYLTYMNSLLKRNLWGGNLYNVCERCAFQLSFSHYDQPKEVMDLVKEIKSLYDKDGIGEEAYRDLVRFLLSVYVENKLQQQITWKLDKSLCEKLSPQNLLQTML